MVKATCAHPIACAQVFALYDYFEDQKAQMEEEAKFNPLPEPPDLNAFRSDRTSRIVEQTRRRKRNRGYLGILRINVKD